jgi:hypothetical protein
MHTASRASLDASLALGNLTNFTKWSTTKTVFTPYKYAVELAGCNGTPMSAYFPIIIALKNDFDTALANPEFDGVLGPNTSALLADAVKNRFNFSGAKPSGTHAVGFLDPYQLWATALDPFSRCLNIDWDSLIPGGISSVISGFCNWASPGTGPEACEKRRQLGIDFIAFHTGTGFFAQKFDLFPPYPAGHKLTLQEVSDYIMRTGGHDSRLGWWTVHAGSSLLFTEVARALLSVRITGSMTVERVAKPLKNRVLTKERAKMSSEKAALLLRVGLNLRFMQAFKATLWDSDDE